MMNGRSVIIVCMTYFIFSCAKQTIDINAAKVSALNNENLVTSNEITSHFFFTDIDIGLNDSIDAASICHGVENIVRVETEQSWLDSLFSGMTYGVYTPREARVYCYK
ncbi:Bor/Iss family lipoprotein [Aeromonas salmonicida]|uniref:Bor/Iss family lipoprotein n=1 Tax=Aeromonas salmonicida TaxID=645 RepID=UPI000743740F|nr:hypothetical protein [Aeromonas salmonicida]HAT04736.1 lipoprotein bor [Aeromonas salmonicida]HBL04446.1 lipoprotein bor [Aeromonas salmonicida]